MALAYISPRAGGIFHTGLTLVHIYCTHDTTPLRYSTVNLDKGSAKF
jgi:hypothetical protein